MVEIIYCTIIAIIYIQPASDRYVTLTIVHNKNVCIYVLINITRVNLVQISVEEDRLLLESRIQKNSNHILQRHNREKQPEK